MHSTEEHGMRLRKQQHERGLFVVCSFAAVMSGTITLPAARHISSCVFVSTILFETKIIDGSHVQREEGTVLLKKQNQTAAQTDANKSNRVRKIAASFRLFAYLVKSLCTKSSHAH